jgi:hypothetical protein
VIIFCYSLVSSRFCVVGIDLLNLTLLSSVDLSIIKWLVISVNEKRTLDEYNQAHFDALYGIFDHNVFFYDFYL